MNANELKQERERRRLTQEEMAELLGSPVSTYRKWEQAARKVPAWVPDKLVPQIMHLEGISLPELLELDQLAREEGLSLDALVGNLIRKGLEHHRARQPAAPAPTSAKRGVK